MGRASETAPVFPRRYDAESPDRVGVRQRSFLGNYKTVLCKEEALQKVINKDPEEGVEFPAVAHYRDEAAFRFRR